MSRWALFAATGVLVPERREQRRTCGTLSESKRDTSAAGGPKEELEYELRLLLARAAKRLLREHDA